MSLQTTHNTTTTSLQRELDTRRQEHQKTKIQLREMEMGNDFRWKYMRTLLGDGNFKQDHLAMKKGSDDVALNDGYGFMVKRRPFEKYIAEAPPVSRQVCL